MVVVQCNIYVQCGNYICSVIHVKYVYSTHCHMVDYSDFICGTYVHIHLPYKFIKYLVYMAYTGGAHLTQTLKICENLSG